MISRILELTALFFGLPFAYTLGLFPVPVLVFLWLGALLAYAFLYTHRGFRFKTIWTWNFQRKELWFVTRRFLFFASLMTLFVYFLDPNKLFEFPRENFAVWLKVMLIYPFFSVLPQSFIYRVFFVERYGFLFSSRTALLIFGSAAFTFMHLVFRNWIALAITAVGGLLFLQTYLRSKNFLLSSFEHALYGCFAFTIGLGSFLYGGTWNEA